MEHEQQPSRRSLNKVSENMSELGPLSQFKIQDVTPNIANHFEISSNPIFFGESSLRRVLREYLAHYHAERNHQGKDKVLLFPSTANVMKPIDESVGFKERLGGLLKYYHLEAA